MFLPFCQTAAAVSVVVSPAAGLTFTCTIGASCASQNLQVTSSSTVPFTVATSVNGSGSFAPFPFSLTVSKTSGTATSTATVIGVTANFAGLAPGAYTGGVTIQPTTAGVASVPVAITLNLTGADSLKVSSTQVNLQAAAGGSSVSQNIVLSTQGALAANALAFNASASSSGGWLSVTPAAGNATATGVGIQITANPASLSGSSSPYTGTVTIVDSKNNAIAVAVSLTAQGPVALSVNPNPVAIQNCFPDLTGKTVSCEQDVVVTSNGSVPFTVGQPTVTSNGIANFPNWLSVSPSSGTANSTGVTLHVTATYTGLAPHTYNGSFTITGSGASNSPLNVPVVFTLGGSDAMVPNPNAVSLNGVAGGAPVVTGPMQVLVTAQGVHNINPVNFSAKANMPWLTVSPAMGAATAAGLPITVTADPKALSASSTPYAGAITLTDSAGNTAAIGVSFKLASASAVTLTVTPDPVLIGDPSGTQCFPDVTGKTVSCEQDVVVTSNGSVPFTVGQIMVTSNGMPNFPNWLSVSPSSGTANSTGATLHVTATYTGLAPHTYNGSFTIMGSAASNSPLTVPVVFTLGGDDTLAPNFNPVCPPGSVSGNPPVCLMGGTNGAPVMTGPKQVLITAQGFHSINPLVFAAKSNMPWLTVSPVMGAATAAGLPLALTADPTKASASSNAGTVTLTDSAGNAVALNVAFTVSAPQFTFTPPSLVFTCPLGSTVTICSPLSASFKVTSNANLTFTATPGYTGTSSVFNNWISVSPTTGTAPATCDSTTPSCTVTVTPLPNGLALTPSGGVYMGNITISAPGASSVSVSVTLNIGNGVSSLQVIPATLPALSAPSGGSAVSQKVTVETLNLFGADTQLFQVSASSTGNWLSATPANGNATASGVPLTIAASPAGLQVSTTPYKGSVTLTDSGGNAIAIPVALTVNPPPPLTITPTEVDFTYTQGGALPASQAVTVTSSSSATISVTFSSTGNWLSAIATGGPTVFNVVVTANPAALSPSATPYCGEVDVTPSFNSQTQKIGSCITVSQSVANVTQPQVIAHLADGQGWTTRVILVNTDSQNAASFQLKFWDESGNPLTLPLGPDGTASSVSGSIPAGSSRIVQTQGLSTTSTSVGWAQLSAPATVGGTSIFTYNNATEASVALTANGAQQLYIPFDNTTGFSTGLALANPAMQNALVSVTMFDDSGNKLTTAQVTVPATGHWANNVDHQIAASGINGVIDSRRPRGHRGVMQLSSNVPVYSIGIRGRTGTPYLFTSLDALHGVPAGNKTIAHLANGGGWATTIELINTDAVAAPFTLNFYDGGGNPLMLAPVNQGPATSVSGTIQPGQIRIVQTDGSGMFNQGSAQLITQNALGGTCIFTENGVSEAAVSIASAGGKTLYIPYDNTGPFLTGIALANPGSSAAPLTKVTFTDSDTGNTIQPTLSQSLIQPNGHYTANVSDYIGAPSRGLIRVDSNVDLFGVAIRLRMAASGAVTYYFTALPVLPVNP